MRHDPEVQQAVDAYQLGLPRSPAAGRSGELLGRGTGSSLEFQEYRQYVPGDDIRHLDWAAFARSDQLMVRLFREEISPRTEILLDASSSMTSSPAKPHLATRLAAMFSLMVGRLGGRPSIAPLDDSPPRSLGLDALPQLDQLPFSGRATLIDQLEAGQVPLRKQAVRILISDFLFPHDPAVLVRRLAADASALWLVQVLGDWEHNPQPAPGRRLVDLETAAEAHLVIDRAAITTYRARLQALQSELIRACRRAHALFATVVAERGLAAACRTELTAAGMLRAG